MMYLNTMGSAVLDELQRTRKESEREFRVRAALAAPTTRPALVSRPEAAKRARDASVPRWRLMLPWRWANVAKAA